MAGPWEKYQTTDEGPWSKYAAPAEEKPSGAIQQAKNFGGGLVRGAGSIGATLLTPYDMLAGNTKSIGNPERRQAMDDALQSLGADPSSFAYGAGKLGGEVAGTLGMGGTIANTAARVPMIARNAAPALEAVRTAGFSTGLPAATTRAGMAGNMALRTAGGGVAGAASAGLVNPEDAQTGGVIGAVAPGALQLAGKLGSKAGAALRGPEQTPELAAAVRDARSAGYVIPPTQAKPTMTNRLIEGMSGKITTAQNASAKNQVVTNDLAAQALGLQPGTKITPDVLDGVRKTAGQAYDALGQTGAVTPGNAYAQALDAIAAPFVKAAGAFPNAKPSPVLDLVESLRSPSFDAGAAVEKIKQLRTAADDGFRTGNTDVARAAKAGAKALEDALEGHLQTIGQPDLLAQFRDARQIIAKTYTVQKALNPASGGVDARKLAAELKKGKPLSGELKQAGDFGLQFPKAAQTVEGMGSLPQTSPLDWVAGSGLSVASGNPLMMGLVAARPLARAAALSPLVQNRLIQQPNALAQMLGGSAVQQNLLRAAPLVGSDR